MRCRAGDIGTWPPRSEQEIRSGLERDVEAERWTSLDRTLRDIAGEGAGFVDLRPGDPGGLKRSLASRPISSQQHPSLRLGQPASFPTHRLVPSLERARM